MPNYRLRIGALNPLPGAPGTVVTLGTQSLYDYLGVVRTALYGDLTAADARLKDRSLALSYCGATIWRGKLAFPVLGGHGDSFDDGGYAFDLTTRTWETIINPTTEGSSSATVDAYGEWTGGAGGRPASQHTLFNLLTIGDDMVQASGSYIGVSSWGSRQAHRWQYSTGLWERYGDTGGGISPSGDTYCHHDSARNRIVRINLTQIYGKIDTIPADDSGATWTSITSSAPSRLPTTIGASIGYHNGLDCYVLFDAGAFNPDNTLYVMDPDDLITGWVPVSVSGITPPSGPGNLGLEYCPPKQCMVSVNPTVSNKLIYITPTGGMTDPWVWSDETFTGTAETWDGYPSGNYNGVYSRFRWYEPFEGFVMLKKSTALVELYVPTV